MEENEQRYVQLLQKELEEERVRRMSIQNEYTQGSAFSNMNKPDTTLAEIQLDLDKELDRIYHLISGHQIGRDADGNEIWKEPIDDRLKILSEHGVNRIMNILHFYLTPNTLLSCYSDEQITWKMRDFGHELNDMVFCQYEYFFYYPSPEQLFEKYLPIMRANKLSIEEVELYKKCIEWSKEEMQIKIRNYPMLIQNVIDKVHTTYLRALNGEERESLRKQMMIHQSANVQTSLMPGQKPGVVPK